jgi:hypothetical protein
MTFVELFGRSNQAKLLDFLTDHVGSYYTWLEITKNVTQVKQNRAAMERLIKVGLIQPVSVGGFKTCFMINDENVLVRAIMHDNFERAKKAAKKEAKR